MHVHVLHVHVLHVHVLHVHVRCQLHVLGKINLREATGIKIFPGHA